MQNKIKSLNIEIDEKFDSYEKQLRFKYIKFMN